LRGFPHNIRQLFVDRVRKLGDDGAGARFQLGCLDVINLSAIPSPQRGALA